MLEQASRIVFFCFTIVTLTRGGGHHGGISLSQSLSQNDRLGPFSYTGSLSASQSSTFSAGYELNHPILGGNHEKVDKEKITFEKERSLIEQNTNYHQNQRYGESYWNKISSNGGYGTSNSYRPTLEIGVGPQNWSPTNWRRPSQLDISIDDNRWNPSVPEIRITDGWQYEKTPLWNSYSCYRRPYRFSNSREEYDWNRRCSRNINRFQNQDQFSSTDSQYSQSSASYPIQTSSPFWINQNHQKPELQISVAAASSGVSSTGNEFSFGQSSSQGNFGSSSLAFNHVQTSENGHSNTQGMTAAIHQNSNGKIDVSFGSGVTIGSSFSNGNPIGTSTSGNKRKNSIGQVINQVNGSGSIHGTANSDSVSSANFPKVENSQIIPVQFVRSKQISNDKRQNRKSQEDPINQFVKDVTNTVADIFDI